MITKMGRRGLALLIAAIGATILLLDLATGRKPEWLIVVTLLAVALIMGLPPRPGG